MADGDIYDMDTEEAEDAGKKVVPAQPLFRIFEGSKIAISKSIGKMWKQRFDAAIKAYDPIVRVWDTVFRYYNNNQDKNLETPRGVFTRGDETENVVFSNVNIVLPAIYSKDPDFTCSTTDEADEPFCKTLEALLNVLVRRKAAPGLNAKTKIKKASGFGLLTNCGVLKLDYTKKDDSREQAVAEMMRITDEMKKVKNPREAEELYGELEALERNLEVLSPNGPSLKNVLPHNLIVDPYATDPDGCDGDWMMERVYLQTAGLMARYTKANPENDDDDDSQERVLVYKPTHKARFVDGGNRDDGLGIVMDAISTTDAEQIVSHTDEERQAYINMYYTECVYVWDKMTRRLMLFHRDDWTWPLWIWDDPLGLSRFFPYYIIGFSFSTGGCISVGETAYYLDQQDAINDINRQMARIRRSVFDFFYYNSDKVTPDDAESFIATLSGTRVGGKKLLGVRAGEENIKDMIQAFAPPELEYEQLFNKQEKLDTVNRITNTSDALRGVQFKTNTNIPAVNTYQESMRLSIGAKVDVVEDVVGDIGNSVAELCIQNMDQEQVAGLIGEKLAETWEEMSVAQFNATYSLTLVAGSMEKPNSVFRKKEAVEVVQAVGQFADAAPGTTLTIMLRMLESAFTDMVIKPEDWDAIKQEIAARTQAEQGQPAPDAAQGNGQDLEMAAQNLPPEDKQRVIEMKQQGVDGREILAFIQERVNDGSQASKQRQQ
jgi:hypothetical protein